MLDTKENKINKAVIYSILLTIGIFIIDLLTPLGVAAAIPYIAVILLSFRFPERRHIIIAGIIVSILTILGFFLSPTGEKLSIVIANRLLALFSIWAGIIFVSRYRSSIEVIHESKESLRKEKETVQLYADELKRSNAELEKSYQKFYNLSARLQYLREEERKTIASEVHDELGGLFTALKLELFSAFSSLKADKVHIDEIKDSLTNLIDKGIEIVQSISVELRPHILDHFGLIPAIEWYVQEFQKRAKIRCVLNLSDESICFDKDRATAVFCIMQEALTNIARHAKASKVIVEVTKTGNGIELKVEDNGIGIDEEKINDPHSFGLMSIQERTLYLGGTLTIKRTNNKGTAVVVNIPVEER